MGKIHHISETEIIVESQESGFFYPKVLTGRPGLIPSEMPQGWTFLKDERGRPLRARTYEKAKEMIDREMEKKMDREIDEGGKKKKR